MNTEEIKELFERYVIPNYTRNSILLTRASGVDVWDAEGKRYLDLFSGWAVSLLGHCHPRVVQAISNQAAKLIHAPNIYYTEPQGILARYISEKSFGGQCFFCNSGAEANEAAIKLARIHNADTGKYKVITFSDSFHGRTIATVTATAQPKYHKGFAPLAEGFSYVPFNDLDALKNAVDEQTCAIMLETMQGEGGVRIATKNFLQGVKKLCDEKGILLILDEVQCGMGRTGEYFAYQHYDIEPDIMTLAKALGGGVAIGAMTAKKEIAKSLVPGSHASTFGGNPLACAAGIAVFETMEKENILENVREMGTYALEQLRALQKTFNTLIHEVRGVGLMIGIELNINGADIIRECIQLGLFLNCTHDTVIRFMPPLNVKKEHIDEGLSILKAALSKY